MKRILSKTLLLSFISSNIALGLEIDPELNQICDAFEKIGVSCGTAYSDSKSFDYKLEKDKNGMIRLKGVYKDYDQFLSAYMITQAIAGVSRVSPAFDSFDTNIKVRKSEICLSALMTGDNSIGDYECDSVKIGKANGGSQSKGSAEKYALILSVGKYKYINVPLGDAPLNDASLVEQNLKQKGYKVITLKNEQATKENVLKTLDEIVASLPKGGTLFLYASTHGSPKSPDGETGIILYDTSIENSKSCKTIDTALQSAGQTRDILISAKKMCNTLSNSLVITEDVIPRINASGKNIRFISSLDVCYSGRVFKNVIEKAREDDTYSVSESVAKYLTFTYPHEMVYVSSASGNQLSLQREFKDKKTYGIFTYHFFTNLPKNSFDLKQNYQQVATEIEKESGATCRALRSQNPKDNCDTGGQKPLLIHNTKVKDYKL